MMDGYIPTYTGTHAQTLTHTHHTHFLSHTHTHARTSTHTPTCTTRERTPTHTHTHTPIHTHTHIPSHTPTSHTHKHTRARARTHSRLPLVPQLHPHLRVLAVANRPRKHALAQLDRLDEVIPRVLRAPISSSRGVITSSTQKLLICQPSSRFINRIATPLCPFITIHQLHSYCAPAPTAPPIERQQTIAFITLH